MGAVFELGAIDPVVAVTLECIAGFMLSFNRTTFRTTISDQDLAAARGLPAHAQNLPDPTRY